VRREHGRRAAETARGDQSPSSESCHGRDCDTTKPALQGR
jgi:hypothetical protein